MHVHTHTKGLHDWIILDNTAYTHTQLGKTPSSQWGGVMLWWLRFVSTAFHVPASLCSTQTRAHHTTTHTPEMHQYSVRACGIHAQTTQMRTFLRATCLHRTKKPRAIANHMTLQTQNLSSVRSSAVAVGRGGRRVGHGGCLLLLVDV
jgi:hypothetical protein